jgi:hypothetical protein
MHAGQQARRRASRWSFKAPPPHTISSGCLAVASHVRCAGASGQLGQRGLHVGGAMAVVPSLRGQPVRLNRSRPVLLGGACEIRLGQQAGQQRGQHLPLAAQAPAASKGWPVCSGTPVVHQRVAGAAVEARMRAVGGRSS